MSAARPRRRMVAVIDPDEAALRLMEAVAGYTRPPGVSAREAVDQFPDDVREQMLTGSQAVIRYVAECVERSEPLQ